MRRYLVAGMCASILAAGAARAERPPLQGDIDLCTLRAENMGRQSSLQGSLRLQFLVRPDGKVFAGYVHSEHGIDDRLLERCILYVAMLWELSPSRLDYSWPYPISFTSGTVDFKHVALPDPQRETLLPLAGQGRTSVFLPDVRHPPPGEPIDAKVAQATLEIAEWATQAESGIAELAVKRYPQAIAQLRGALEAGRDPLALRGLSQALVETKTNLDEARALAEELIALEPASEQGHETLLRVCLATGDDVCAFEQFKLANGAPDLSLRWVVLRDDLLEPAKLAAARLRDDVLARAAGAEPCTPESGEPAQALCLVKRCLSDGTQLYAKELSEQRRAEYRVAEWSARAAAPGKVVVSRPIVPAGGGDAEPLLWVVRERGDQLVVAPSNATAQRITAKYNRCAGSPEVLR